MTRQYQRANYKGEPIEIEIDDERDELLTDFGKATLSDRYLHPGESFQDLFARVATYFADSNDHAQRLYYYISKHWFMPATPILSNGGTNNGFSISCFLNSVEDSLESISETFTENLWLGSGGGGIGTCFSDVRSVGEKVRSHGKSSGVIPYIKVLDSQTLAISQGSLRRASAAVYLDISHPEIIDFIELRKFSGGDPNRKAHNVHHGVMIPDAFMKAVEKGTEWNLISPKTKEVVSTHSAREIWIRLLTARLETGEPYIGFSDTIRKERPKVYKYLDLQVKQSNLCSEILLTTGRDHLNNIRTAVCCLSSLNIKHFTLWEKDRYFIPDIMRFLDNVLTDFINKAPSTMARAKYSAMRERSVGLGVMGFHSFLQQKAISFDSLMTRPLNKYIFRHIRKEADRASIALAKERGANPDCAEACIIERFSHKLAIAPTASISIIAGNTSPCVEPFIANVFTQKTLSGSFRVANQELKAVLKKLGRDTDETWSSISQNKGSVQHLPFLTQEQKEVFRTAVEIDNTLIITLAADRTPQIDQGQSINLFLAADIDKKQLHNLHFDAWKKGVKTLYYCRSMSLQRASNGKTIELSDPINPTKRENDGETCNACQ